MNRSDLRRIIELATQYGRNPESEGYDARQQTAVNNKPYDREDDQGPDDVIEDPRKSKDDNAEDDGDDTGYQSVNGNTRSNMGSTRNVYSFDVTLGPIYKS